MNVVGSVRRKIVARKPYRTAFHPDDAADSVMLVLECKHTKSKKASQAPKTDFAFCTECRGAT